MTEKKTPSLLSTLAAASKKSPATKPVSLLRPAEKVKPVVNEYSEVKEGGPDEIPPKAPSSLLQTAKVVAKQRAEVNQKAEAIFKEMPMDFQTLLDDFDSMVASDAGIDMLTLDTARAYVKRIMIDLKEHPEYDGLIIDRDVHNIIKFIRSLRESAIGEIAEKKEKKEKRTTRAKVKKSRFGDTSGLTLDLKAADIGSLEDLSDLEL